jgi:hypothetical protein
MVLVPVCGAGAVADTELVVVVVDSFSEVLPPQPAANIVATTAAVTASDRMCRSDVVVKNLWAGPRVLTLRAGPPPVAFLRQ